VLKANPEFESVRVLDGTGRVWASNRFAELFTLRRPGAGRPAVPGGDAIRAHHGRADSRRRRGGAGAEALLGHVEIVVRGTASPTG